MTNRSDVTAVNEQLTLLRQSYHARLPSVLAALNAHAEQLSRASDQRPILIELHRQLHKLAGGAGSFGQAELGCEAKELEEHIRDALQRNKRIPAQKLIARIHQLAEHVQEIDGSPLQAESGKEAKGRHALWVLEPDPGEHYELTEKLSPFNYEVRCFAHHSSLFDCAKATAPYGLILNAAALDANGDGHDIESGMKQLQQRGSQLMVFADDDSFQSRVRASSMGALAFQVTPINIPKLVERLEKGAAHYKAPPGRVLIVDDDRDLAEHYRLTLTLAGLEAEVLDSPENIIDALQTQRPELVLMDLHMPRYSGPDLAGVIRQYDRWTSLPIVYLSVETDLELQAHALSRGADDFLTKPLGDAQLVASVRARIQRARELSDEIVKDSLTGLLKHAAVKEAAEQEVQRSRRSGQPVTLAMLDIDHFKAVNDSYGHATGDTVISAVALLLNQRLRQSDVVGRYGGEEFLAILPNCSLASAETLLNEIRERFAEIVFVTGDDQFSCTLSAGIACRTKDATLACDKLLVEADMALYKAKHAGRNRVCAATESCTENR